MMVIENMIKRRYNCYYILPRKCRGCQSDAGFAEGQLRARVRVHRL